MTTRTRKRVDFSELGWLAARIGSATVKWRLERGLGPIPEGFKPEDVEAIRAARPAAHTERA